MSEVEFFHALAAHAGWADDYTGTLERRVISAVCRVAFVVARGDGSLQVLHLDMLHYQRAFKPLRAVMPSVDVALVHWIIETVRWQVNFNRWTGISQMVMPHHVDVIAGCLLRYVGPHGDLAEYLEYWRLLRPIVSMVYVHAVMYVSTDSVDISRRDQLFRTLRRRLELARQMKRKRLRNLARRR